MIEKELFQMEMAVTFTMLSIIRAKSTVRFFLSILKYAKNMKK